MENDGSVILPPKASYDTWEAVLRPLNYTIRIWSDAEILHLIQNELPVLDQKG